MHPFAAQVFIGQALAAQVPQRQALQAMRFVHFQHIALQHGVVHIALHLDAVVGKHMAVVFHMLAQLVFRRVLQPRFELGQHLSQWQLRGRIGGVVAQGDVSGSAWRDAHADAHNLRLHLHQRGGFGVQGHQVGGLYLLQPCIKTVPIEHSVVMHLGAHRGCGCIEQHTHLAHARIVQRATGGFGGRLCTLTGFQCSDQALEAILLEKINQACLIGCLHDHAIQRRQARYVGAQIAIGFHGDQLPAGGQPVPRLAQVFTGHAFDLIGSCHQRF